MQVGDCKINYKGNSNKLKKLQPFNPYYKHTKAHMKTLKNQIITLNTIHNIDN